MWFVALPDNDQAVNLVRAGGFPGDQQRIDYSSGNPWLIGRWRSHEIRLIAEARQTRVFVAGVCLADTKRMTADAEAAIATGRYENLTEFPGSYFVLVVTGREFRLFGDVAGLCRLFCANVNKLPLVASRSDVLGFLAGADINYQWLAGALASAAMPPPLNDETPWVGVHAVMPGQYVLNERERGLCVRRYWSPPMSNRSLRDGAPDVSAALMGAVSLRVQSISRVSCDMSGGKDSTAISFLSEAASDPSQLLAVTMPSIAPDNDDLWWATQAAAHLPSLRRLVIDERDCPLPYQDIGEARPWTDEPSEFSMHSARYRRLVEGVLDDGSELHLTGHGGDDVLEAPLTYLRETLKRRPCRAISHIRGYTALTGRPFSKYVSEVFRHATYGSWLRYLADRVICHKEGFANGWTDVPTLPPWITRDAAFTVRESLLRAAADDIEPTVQQSEFAAIFRIQDVGRMARLHRQFMSQLGLRVDFPYLDRTVVEACLAVRGDERTTPRVYKPLLNAAMSGVMPRKLLDRASKGHYTEDTLIGLRRQKGAIVEIFKDSVLGQRGLVDPGRINNSIMSGRWESLPLADLTTTLACELWLRDAEAFIKSTPSRMDAIQ